MVAPLSGARTAEQLAELIPMAGPVLSTDETATPGCGVRFDPAAGSGQHGPARRDAARGAPADLPRTMPDDFARRLTAAQTGDEAAFTALFRAVQPLLLRYLRTLAPTLADDVAAETWVSVVRGLHRFAGDESGFRGWVFTIARARLVDARRTAGRAPVPVDAHAELAERPGTADVEASVDELMSTEAALALIGQLPPDQAEAVLLRHVAGLDATEAARVLGKRPGAVRVATMRGLTRLRSLLPPDVERRPAPGCNTTDRTIG